MARRPFSFFHSGADASYRLYAPLLTLRLSRLMRPLLDISVLVMTLFALLRHFVYAEAVATSDNLPELLVNGCPK